MFPASFRRSPLFCVLAHRSEPARSQRHSLETKNKYIKKIHRNEQKPKMLYVYVSHLLLYKNIIRSNLEHFFPQCCLVSQPYCPQNSQPHFIFQAYFKFHSQIRFSPTRLLCGPLEFLHLQSSKCEWRTYCDCRERNRRKIVTWY